MNDKQTKHKMCTMNCGGTISDPRTKEERQAACSDCIEVDTRGLAQPPDSAGSIESQLDRITLLKMHSLIDQGMKPVGVVMMNTNGKRATIDMGRVTWTDGISDVSDINVGDMPENGAGIGSAPEPDAFKSAMPAKLRALSAHMERIAVEMNYLGGFAEWAKHGVELFGAAGVVEHWTHEIEVVATETRDNPILSNSTELEAPAIRKQSPCPNCMDTRIERGVYANTECQFCKEPR